MSNIEMLTPENSKISLINYRPAMCQGVQPRDRLVPFNNGRVLAAHSASGEPPVSHRSVRSQ